jgi:ribosomal protein S18 acetylase RimI-like enzyme
VVQVHGTPVGVITLSDRGDELHLTWMALLPQYQRLGLGTALVRHAQERARSLGRPLTLQVLRQNPAVEFYERVGFHAYATSGPHVILMKWLSS